MDLCLGNIDENSYKSDVHNGKIVPSDLLNRLKRREIISKALGDNKGIIDKIILSNNPYAIFFKLYFTESKSKDKVLDEIKSNFYFRSLIYGQKTRKTD